jgi:hypothetical protein
MPLNSIVEPAVETYPRFCQDKWRQTLKYGAMVGGYLGDPQTVARSLFDAGRAVIEFPGASRA